MKNIEDKSGFLYAFLWDGVLHSAYINDKGFSEEEFVRTVAFEVSTGREKVQELDMLDGEIFTATLLAVQEACLLLTTSAKSVELVEWNRSECERQAALFSTYILSSAATGDSTAKSAQVYLPLSYLFGISL